MTYNPVNVRKQENWNTIYTCGSCGPKLEHLLPEELEDKLKFLHDHCTSYLYDQRAIDFHKNLLFLDYRRNHPDLKRDAVFYSEGAYAQIFVSILY